jgi:hypothetical protein
MNKKQIALGVVLVDFLAFSAYAVAQYGYLGLFEQMLANAATLQVLADLGIALSLVTVWMWQDARQHGISPVPYVVLTATLGSVGPLVYLIRRFGTDPVVAPHSVVPTRAAVRA